MNTLDSIINTKQVRVNRTPERYSDDGSYDNRPVDPNYFNNYYQTHKETTMCKHCSSVYTCKAGLHKHPLRSAKYQKLRGEIC